MPYTKSNPPERIKTLPKHAQEIWVEAYNSAWKEYEDDEERCNKIAWGAVKNAGYKQNKEGEWIKEEKLKEETEFSDKPWSDVDKSKLPKECFLIVGDPELKSTWKLPYREGTGSIGEDGMYEKAGPVNKGALRAILAVMGGARGEIEGGIPEEVKEKVKRLAKEAGIGEPAKEEIQEQIKRRSKTHKDKSIIEQVDILEAQPLGDHKYKVEIINLEPPNVLHRGWSLNERYYTDNALLSLAKKINGKPLIASGHHKANPEFSDLAGMYSDGQKVPGKKIVTAVAEILGVAQETVEPFVQKQVSDKRAKLIALSHNSKGDTYWGTDPQNRKGDIVENLTEVYSTDIVFLPGAGGNFQKIAEDYRRKKMQDLTLKELKEENPELVRKIQEEALEKDQKEKMELKEAKEKVEKELKTLKEEKFKEDSSKLATKLLNESKLTESQALGLLESMVSKTEEEMKKLIEERKNLLRANAKDLKVLNFSEDKDNQTQTGSLTEEEKKFCKQTGLKEEFFLKTRQEILGK